MKPSVEILDQVFRVLDTYGKPHQSVGDPDFVALFLRDTGMRHGGRVTYQALNASKRFG